MKRKPLIYLSLGTNLGNRQLNLNKSMELIEMKVGKIIKQSSVYQTKAWGVKDQPDFLNMVLEVETKFSPQFVLTTILSIETEMGRIRERKWYTRLIDIDLLFYEDLIIKESNLIVPHPYLQDRNFVLAPLMEIAPSLVHPVIKKTIEQLVEECRDTLVVEKIDFTYLVKSQK